jgi:hypothetical protein
MRDITVKQENLENFVIQALRYFSTYRLCNDNEAFPLSWVEFVERDFPSLSTRALCEIEHIILGAGDNAPLVKTECFQNLALDIGAEIEAREDVRCKE